MGLGPDGNCRLYAPQPKPADALVEQLSAFGAWPM